MKIVVKNIRTGEHSFFSSDGPAVDDWAQRSMLRSPDDSVCEVVELVAQPLRTIKKDAKFKPSKEP